MYTADRLRMIADDTIANNSRFLQKRESDILGAMIKEAEKGNYYYTHPFILESDLKYIFQLNGFKVFDISLNEHSKRTQIMWNH
jgi:hypothetical protein